MTHGMTLQSITLRASLFVAASLWGLSPAFASDAPHWSYAGPAGPGHWAELSPAFEACARGHAQSPVDIRKAVTATLPTLRWDYGTADPSIVNNGHTVQVDLPPGQHLAIGDRRYDLVQFHFHTPSENAMQGRRAPMEVHFVHRDEQGRLAVVAVLLRAGKHNEAFAPVFAHLPRGGERVTVEGLHLDLAALLPRNFGYFRFQGSLTTPPCSEGVDWIVLKEPMTLGADQIRAFRRLFRANARPLQPIDGRTVEASA